jgi:hypothetical protein
MLLYKKRKDCDDMNIILSIFSSAIILGVPLFSIYFPDIISDKVIENLELKNNRKEKIGKMIYNNNLRFIVYIFMILMFLSFTYLKVLPFLIGIWLLILFICLCIMNKRLGDNLNDYLEKTLLKEEK